MFLKFHKKKPLSEARSSGGERQEAEKMSEKMSIIQAYKGPKKVSPTNNSNCYWMLSDLRNKIVNIILGYYQKTF